MKKTICIIHLLCISAVLFAQKHDNIWVLGYYGQSPHPDLGGIFLDFNQASLLIYDVDTGMDFNFTDASICDAQGKLLFYTNGIYIADATHEVMENGDSINNAGLTYQYTETGLPVPQGVLVLPAPGNDSLYYLFHGPIDFGPNGLNTHIPKLFYSKVNMNLNGGLGAVIEKDHLLIEDTLAIGKLTACKHANGRDWWLLVRKDERFSRNVYRLLLTPQGVLNMGKQDAGPDIIYPNGAVGNVVFSPDGTKYVSHEIRFNPRNAIDIYDFDRCTGELQHLEHFTMDDSIFLTGGASVSPDSRLLYIVTHVSIFQFDLLAADIEATRNVVAEYDGFIGYPYPSKFGIPQIGSNGKIYIASYATDTFMHVINTPNQPGLGSHVAQHSIGLSNLNDKSIPNFPNYRLGPLDGSPCDTLGLDNHPLAGFTWYAEELEITFSDNSYYRPEQWLWDFGDGSSSTERNPIHSYAVPGEYYVCLTVSNEYDSDTACHWVSVDTLLTATEPLSTGGSVRLYPNPAREEVWLSFDEPLTHPATWTVFDTVGRQVGAVALQPGKSRYHLFTGGLASGLYFWNLQSEGRILAAGKVVRE
ncbi:MAG: hypothetical protein CMJ42_16930 [Phyllobacteriaceae bacterium]|nr:hypothetical protein [Phyllobacteriaceae bacterium]